MSTTRRPASIALEASPHERSDIADVVLLVVVAFGLLAFFAQRYPVKGYYFPVGPDTPVYLWWTRLAAHEGLSAVGLRPGVPALTLTLAGTLHLSRVEVLAGIGVAGGVCIGMASAALVDLGSRDPSPSLERRLRMVAAAVLAGTFAVHLADGYFANLVQAALFLAAAVTLAAGTRAGAVAAAALLAAGGLTHPQFFLLGCVILLLTAALTLVRRPRDTALVDVEGGRILAAVLGGGALALAGFGALRAGPHLPRVDTSQDAFLRRAGLRGLLHREYRGRFTRHLARYVLEVQVPLAAVGIAKLKGFLARFLGTWSVLLVVGVTGALVTGLVPAVRFFAFGYVLPILAALGLVRLWRWVGKRSRPAAALVALGLVVAVVLGAMFTWFRTKPFVSRTELARAAVAGRIASATTPPGTPIVFVVDTGRRNVSFVATRVNNVLRDAVPPELIRRVYVFVGSPRDYLHDRPSLNGQVPHDAMSRLYLKDIRRAGRRPLAFVLAPFNREYFDLARSEGDLVSRGVIELRPHPRAPDVATAPPEDTAPSSGWRLAFAALAVTVTLGAAGYGWARVLVSARSALALAAPFGAGGLILVSILFERLGAPLTGWGPPVVSVVTAGGGYLTLLRSRRRNLPDEPGAVAKSPEEVT